MTCYNWEDHPKPWALIGTLFVGGVERRLIISFYIIQLRWGYGTRYSHRLRWCGFNQVVFTIWCISLSSVLGTLLETILFGRVLVSLCCGLCGDRGMIGFLRILGRWLRWCGTCFISMFLFGLTVLMFWNHFLWV